jgi:hypothetical protein
MAVRGPHASLAKRRAGRSNIPLPRSRAQEAASPPLRHTGCPAAACRTAPRAAVAARARRPGFLHLLRRCYWSCPGPRCSPAAQEGRLRAAPPRSLTMHHVTMHRCVVTDIWVITTIHIYPTGVYVYYCTTPRPSALPPARAARKARACAPHRRSSASNAPARPPRRMRIRAQALLLPIPIQSPSPSRARTCPRGILQSPRPPAPARAAAPAWRRQWRPGAGP